MIDQLSDQNDNIITDHDDLYFVSEFILLCFI